MFLIVDDNIKHIKKLMIEIEENSLGRIYDIDVLNGLGEKISRSDLGYENRKCLICNEDVFICMRNKTHSYEELKRKIYEDYINYKILIERGE